VGQHTVELEASDPISKSTTAQTLNIEPDQIYQTTSLKIKYKGMRYAVAPPPKIGWGYFVQIGLMATEDLPGVTPPLRASALGNLASQDQYGRREQGTGDVIWQMNSQVWLEMSALRFPTLELARLGGNQFEPSEENSKVMKEALDLAFQDKYDLVYVTPYLALSLV
jgi:hypothetical protein